MRVRLWRAFLVLAGVNGFVAVAAAAYGAHALAGPAQDHARELVEKGAHYQLIHTAVLAGLGLTLWSPGFGLRRWVLAAGAAFVLGMALFSGSLYLIAATGDEAWRWVTPFGGTSFLAGWLILALAGGFGGRGNPP